MAVGLALMLFGKLPPLIKPVKSCGTVVLLNAHALAGSVGLPQHTQLHKRRFGHRDEACFNQVLVGSAYQTP